MKVQRQRYVEISFSDRSLLKINAHPYPLAVLADQDYAAEFFGSLWKKLFTGRLETFSEVLSTVGEYKQPLNVS